MNSPSDPWSLESPGKAQLFLYLDLAHPRPLSGGKQRGIVSWDQDPGININIESVYLGSKSQSKTSTQTGNTVNEATSRREKDSSLLSFPLRKKY